MASPEGVTPIYNNVIISVYGGPGSSGFGIRSVGGVAGTAGFGQQWAVGSVYKIGSNVYKFIVGDKVGFKTDAFFATDTSDDTFAVVPEENIMITYTTPP